MIRIILLLCVALSLSGQVSVVPDNAIRPDSSGNVTIGTTVLVSESLCDGTTDARTALQAILTAHAGKQIVLPPGRTCLITPVADKSKFLSLPVGTILRGTATLKVANASAPYDAVLQSSDCTGCRLSEFTIDDNIDNNPLVDVTDTVANPRVGIWILSGTDIAVRGVTVTNSSGTQQIAIYGNRVSVEDSHFTNIGDDPTHLAHDLSTLYLQGNQISVARNHFIAASLGAPAAYTAIEMHGSGYSITGNTMRNYANGMNITGIYTEDSVANSITGNTVSGALYGVAMYSDDYSTHTSGYGLNGLVVSGNSIRINQTSYTTPIWGDYKDCGGIFLIPLNDLPVRNLSITGNVVVFDQEDSVRLANTASVGIGYVSLTTPARAIYDVLVSGNIIDNSPLSAIRFSVGSSSGLRVTNNIIRNAGQSLDTGIAQGLKTPLFLYSSVGTLHAEVRDNTVIDDFGISRTQNLAWLGSSVTSGHDVSFVGNTVSLTGATTTAWVRHFSQADAYVKPFVRMVTASKAWAAPTNTMRAGSEVFDATTALRHYLHADGTGWTKAFRVSNGSPFSFATRTDVLTANREDNPTTFTAAISANMSSTPSASSWNLELPNAAGTGRVVGLSVTGDGSVQLPTAVTFATLPAAPNGSVVWCSDCTATCTAGSGTGRMCFRENGAWTR